MIEIFVLFVEKGFKAGNRLVKVDIFLGELKAFMEWSRVSY